MRQRSWLVERIDHDVLPRMERAYRTVRVVIECDLVNWVRGAGLLARWRRNRRMEPNT